MLRLLATIRVGLFDMGGNVTQLAGLLEQKVDEAGKELQCIKTTLLASMQGYAPQISVEFARKSLPAEFRPTFAEVEEMIGNLPT